MFLSLSICLSHSISSSLSLFSSSSGPAQAFLLLDPECHFMLVERSGVKVTPLCGDRLGVSVTLESLLLMLQACRSAFGLVSAVYSCTCTHTCTLSPLFTHTHMLTWTICSASPVTGPRYRSIIYLRPLTLRIRSRFRPVMASLAQHPCFN